MKSLENTFVRGPSPSYSDEVNSENVISATLPIGSLHQMQRETLKPKNNHDFYNCHNQQMQQQQQHHYEDPTKPIKQGRNTFAFWTIVIILLVLTVGNLLLTLTIIGVLHMGKGIHGMELIPEEDVVKFYGETDLDRIFSKNIGQFEGFADEPVTITGDDAPVYVRMHHRNSQSVNRMVMDKIGIQFRGVNTFEIKDPTNGDIIFTTHRPHYNIPQGAETLVSKTNSASRIASPIDKPLTLSSSDNRIFIKGSEGIHMDSANVYMQAENNIQINSTQGGIYLEGGSAGIYLDISKIPIVNSELGLRTGSVQYKLCVCMPQGIVFRIAIPRVHNGSKVSCAHFSGKHDPCTVN
ncbi:sarcoglycan beta isoform 1-T4 [Cochliomyia hominivorax]